MLQARGSQLGPDCIKRNLYRSGEKCSECIESCKAKGNKAKKQQHTHTHMTWNSITRAWISIRKVNPKLQTTNSDSGGLDSGTAEQHVRMCFKKAWIGFSFQMSSVLQGESEIIVMIGSMNMRPKRNSVIHREVIIPRAVGYLIVGICARAAFQIAQWAPKVYAKSARIVITSDKIIYLQALCGVLQQLLCDFCSWSWHAVRHMPVFSHNIYIYFIFHRKSWQRKKWHLCNTGIPLKSMQMKCLQALQRAFLVAWLTPSSPGETLVLSASEEILLKHPSPCTIDSI